MIKNNERYMISQTPSKKTAIFFWIWYELLIVIALSAVAIFIILKIPIPLTMKLSFITITVSIIAILFAQIDELGGSPILVVRKVVSYTFNPKRFLFKPRKDAS